MVSLLAIGASAAINALAFSGTNYIFSKFSDHGEAERKRHDIALEDLLRDRDDWCKAKTIRTGTSTIRLLQCFRSVKIRRVVICNSWYSN